jgi:spermidine/putrescine transport system substrate-binding protein
MKKLLLLALVLLLAIPAAAPAEEEKVLNILTWADYIDSDTLLTPFEEEFGVKINYDFFDSNEEMLMKLQALEGGTYDIVLASDYAIDIARNEGLILKLDKEQLPNFQNINPNFQGQFFDPTDEYSVPYIAGIPLIVYDPAYVDIEITGYNSLWDESLKDGLVMMDDMRNIIGITLKSMGESFNVTDPEILAAAEEKLMQLKPNIRVLDYNRPDLPLVSGDAIAGYLFTPAVVWALDERPDLKVVYPEEGMGFGIDSLFIPVNAPHPGNAHDFLDFLLRPENGATIAEVQAYICVNQASESYLTDEYKAALYIPDEVMAQIHDSMEFIEDVGEATPLYDEIWVRFKQ